MLNVTKMNLPAKKFQLSVVIPAYSEKNSLIRNIKEVLKNKEVFEVIIIVAAAADPETLEICKQLATQEEKVTYHIQKINPGLGYALREAFELVRGTHVQILYADCESDPAAVPVMIRKALETNADMVIASRWVPGGAVHHYPPVRYFFNRAYQQFFRILFSTHIHDLTFGYNLIKTSVLRRINWQAKKHEITTEMVLKASKLGYRLEEIPVVWRRRDEGKSALVIIRYLYYPYIALLIFLCPKRFLSLTEKPKQEGAQSFISKAFDSNILIGVILALFISITALVLYNRDGKDFKVGLYAVAQVLDKKSPYINPLDPPRPIFRYAPGVTILERPFFLSTKVVGPYEFKNDRPSIYAWFIAEILALLGSVYFLYKLIPASSKVISLRNLKMSFVLALPLIIYEIINSQNKLIALFFMFAAIFLFKNKKLFWSAFCFSIALTIYVALLPFLFYFLIRDRKYIVSFITAILIVFFLIPSLVFGFDFNNYLLKEWMRSLHSFFMTNSYATYIDLRKSSQSIPSVVGRIFVSGNSDYFSYFISPIVIHFIIRIISSAVLLCSCFAIWRNPNTSLRGLSYATFLILALILPQYCVYYTWAYLFVIYFAILNFISFPNVPYNQKRNLLIGGAFLCLASYGIVFNLLNQYSMLFWATIILWAGMITILLNRRELIKDF